MSKDEVLKLALEALVSSTGELHRHLASPNDYQLVKNHRAIAAIKAALEAKDEPDHSDELTIAYMSGLHRGKEVAQRTWVGLTDEHKEGLIYMTDPNPEPHHLRELIDVVEFQLKEKNA